jgi:hypothetical protein
VQSLMSGHICSELLDLVALAERVIAGEEVEISESFEYEDTDVLVIQSSLKEFILTVDGSGKDMKITLRSVEIPELVIGLPTPVYVNLGKPIIVEDFC